MSSYLILCNFRQQVGSWKMVWDKMQGIFWWLVCLWNVCNLMCVNRCRVGVSNHVSGGVHCVHTLIFLHGPFSVLLRKGWNTIWHPVCCYSTMQQRTISCCRRTPFLCYVSWTETLRQNMPSATYTQDLFSELVGSSARWQVNSWCCVANSREPINYKGVSFSGQKLQMWS